MDWRTIDLYRRYGRFTRQPESRLKLFTNKMNSSKIILTIIICITALEAVGQQEPPDTAKPVDYREYRGLFGEDLCGNVFVFRYEGRLVAGMTRHQFDDEKVPSQAEAIEGPPIPLDNEEVFLQKDVQILPLKNQELKMPFLDFDLGYELKNGELLWIERGGSLGSKGGTTGKLLAAGLPDDKYTSKDGPKNFVLELDSTVDVRGASGSAVFQVSTGKPIGVLLSADDGKAAKHVVFESICLPLDLKGQALNEWKPELPALTQVLALEVDRRFVQPLYDRAVDKDSAKLDDAIGKLLKLSAEKGVRKLADNKIQISLNGDKVGGLKQYTMELNKPDKFEARYKMGNMRLVNSEGDLFSNLYRTLMVRTKVGKENYEIFRFTFSHQLENHWTVSAICQSKWGAVFVFERYADSEADGPVPRDYLLLGLLEKKSKSGDKALNGRSFLNASPGPVALLRLAATRFMFAKVETNIRAVLPSSKQYASSTLSFTGSNLSKPAQEIAGTVQFRRIVSSSSSLDVRHEGTHQMNCGDATDGKEEGLDVWEGKLKWYQGGTRGATKRKKQQYVFSSTLVIPAQ